MRDLLDALCAGGIYDHLGGGFARYSVDAEWHVPHFEKMLYDNAQILELLALAHAETPSPVYAARARETFDWLQREMKVGERVRRLARRRSGGRGGLFYVWTRRGDRRRCSATTRPRSRPPMTCAPSGNWEGRNVLRLAKPVDAATGARLPPRRARLLALRERRPRPGRDDKILADWNGLMIAALARAAAVFDAPDYARRRQRGVRFSRRELARRARAARCTRGARARIGAAGMLDDYAAMARAALACSRRRASPRYLERAEAWADAALARFGADDGGFYLTAADAEER